MSVYCKNYSALLLSLQLLLVSLRVNDGSLQSLRYHSSAISSASALPEIPGSSKLTFVPETMPDLFRRLICWSILGTRINF